ncbi:MAG: 3-dehydroquinate synthase [Marinifilaceae bacterium]
MGNIIFTQHVGSEVRKLVHKYGAEHCFMLLDENGHKSCFPYFYECGLLPNHVMVIPSGELQKNMETVARIWEFLVTHGATRHALMINVGGGVITDMGGFAASCFKRGMTFVNIPTTLLAQVDASVGGKTGVNFLDLKNEIGVFSLPYKVFIDNCFLKTLSAEEILSGYGEMLKHALLSSTDEVNEVLNMRLGDIGSAHNLELIRRSVEVKAAIVEEDPREEGIRKALNLGHTVAHALESAAFAVNKPVSHGMAVALGLIVELRLSVMKLDFPEGWYNRVRKYILEHYPAYPMPIDAEVLCDYMTHDKKNDDRGINFTLLLEPGEFYIDNICTREEIVEALKSLNV